MCSICGGEGPQSAGGSALGWVLRRSFHGFHPEEDLLKGSLRFGGEVEVGCVVFDDTNQKFTPQLLGSRPP